jgi:hypothetical protein
MNRLAFVCVAAVTLMAQGRQGIRPRPNASDYPAHEAIAGTTIAAVVLSPDEVRNLFATDLHKGGYIVVEVGVYPEGGQDIDLSSSDFILKIGSDNAMVRPVSAATIASVLQRKSEPRQVSRGRDVTLYPTAEIGYESGGYDPVTGRRRSGVYTGTGVGVGIGDNGPSAPPRPASTDRDRTTMRQELEDKALPEGKTAQPVAGYLYFPSPTGKHKNAMYDITYIGANGKARLAVPPPK